LNISVKPRQTLKRIRCFKTPIRATAGCLLVICSQTLLANDYLNELATEAEATAAVSKNSQLNSGEKKQLKEMEALLESEKPSTYKFYVKLNKNKKQRVYEAYANDQSESKRRLHHLQKKVMDLYFAQ
jgi:hypothetical protein